MKLSIVIPLFNEESVISATHKRVSLILAELIENEPSYFDESRIFEKYLGSVSLGAQYYFIKGKKGGADPRDSVNTL